ncbi:MAG: hypothetical protein KDA52_12400 [Planctomycetaceae bacterium]|nr:hypothetical protein [Planctomycetaceae bacterium]
MIHEKNEPQTENPLRGVPYPLTVDRNPGSIDQAKVDGYPERYRWRVDE